MTKLPQINELFINNLTTVALSPYAEKKYDNSQSLELAKVIYEHLS
jgi:hypothetical protein